MRFSSIRWRLATTYGLVTVAVVAMVGLVALSLIKQQTRQQEQAYLAANAQVVAKHAGPLFHSPAAGKRLQALVETSAFLSNSRIQVRGAGGELLADSGFAGKIDEFIVMAPPEAVLDAMPFTAADWMLVPGIAASAEPMVELNHDAARWPPGQVMGVVERGVNAWGQGYELKIMAEPALAPVPAGKFTALGAELLAKQLVRPPADRSSLTAEVPIGVEAGPVGYVVVSEAPNVGGAALSTSYRAFGVAAACAVALALLMSLLVSRRITAPLAHLTSAAQRMSGGDLTIRAAVFSRDEVGRLAAQFNDMAARLHASFAELAAERDTLRRFVADASHELRTPITALKTFNELLQSYAAGDEAARAEFLAESQLQVERLEAIVHHLLDLSRLDAQLVPLDLDWHESADLVGLTARRFRPLAQERGLDLELALDRPAGLIRCDRLWLELALSNLIDNAIKFSPPGAAIELGVRAGESATSLWVRDGGPGIAPEDLPHIFERFYRSPAVRAPGSGLGLAIVQSVVQAHGGEIAVESAPGRGSRFTITLHAGRRADDPERRPAPLLAGALN